ncbi:stage III sporulation protein AA [Halocella sp. SP3-1]|nr:stage III sporulation protein AA [Halocella sp. SP3-1]
MRLLSENLLDYLPERTALLIGGLSEWRDKKLVEIRLRVNQAIQLIGSNIDFFIDLNGKRLKNSDRFYGLNREEMEKAFLLLSHNSIYALERQLLEGFITIPGGHRVGFTGQVVVENARIKTIKNINSLNYRICREFTGAAEDIVTYLYDRERDLVLNTLIVSPPLCGKTTLLRDLIRIFSQGMLDKGIKGKKVGLVDERSEIAGAYKGVPQNNIGSRTDLLDNCPKAEGMMLLIRSMSPEVIAVDEIGRDEDINAIQEALYAGVSLITTIHGRDFTDIKRRPGIADLIDKGLFERFIFLSNRAGIGTIEAVRDRNGREVSCFVDKINWGSNDLSIG